METETILVTLVTWGKTTGLILSQIRAKKRFVWPSQCTERGNCRVKGCAPSFSGLRPANEGSSRAKRRNRRRDTHPEVLLRSHLWRLGLRFRKNVETMLGKPDIVFTKAKVVVFCDGDFWHGRDWKRLQPKLRDGFNGSYWVNKIQSNIDRDERVTTLLEDAGWCVLRSWEADVKRDPEAIARSVKAVVDDQLRAVCFEKTSSSAGGSDEIR